MAFWNKRKAEERAIPPPTSTPNLGGFSLSPVTPTNALQVADVWACVKALSDAASSLPIHTYRRTERGRVRVGGRGAELLARPAPATTTPNFVSQTMVHLLVYGNAYVAKFRQAGEIRQLGLLHPEQVEVKIDKGRPIYEVWHNNRRVVASTDDIVHIRGMSMDGIVGLSPIRQVQTALELSDTLARYGVDTLHNQAVPKGVLRIDRYDDTTEIAESLTEAWETRHQGSPGRIAIVPGVIDYKPVALPMGDLQFLEQRKLSTVEICRVFRVPPWIVGADSGGSMTYSNVEQQGLHFVTYSLRPWLVLIEEALSADRDLFPGDAYCQFAIDALLRSDSKSRAEFFRMALDPITGWLTRAEVRELEDRPPEVSEVGNSNGAGRLEDVEVPQ